MVSVSAAQSESLKVEKDFQFLLEQYLEVLRGLPEEELIRAVASRERPKHMEARASQALGLYFSLLNMVEENAAAQARRSLESLGEPCGKGMFRSVFCELAKRNPAPSVLRHALASTSIEPVLTAHPTEAKRTSILEHHRELYLCLVRMENQMWTPEERAAIVDEAKSIIEKIWKTGEIYHAKPNVQDEQNNVLHYLQKVFPIVVPEVYNRLKQAWNWAKLPQPFPDDAELLPLIRFGSWVGGDRDGHPLVQVEHTRNAFSQFREGAMQLLHERLARLASSFSMNEEFARPNATILRRLEEMEREVPRFGKPGETWRHYLNQVTLRLTPVSAAYTHAKQLLQDLRILREALVQVGCGRVVEIELDPVIQLVRVFPFTLAKLDFRQNSEYQEKAFLQLLSACPDALAEHYQHGSDSEKQHFLEQELLSGRPFTRLSQTLAAEAQATLELYRTLREELRDHQDICIGWLITSMTRSASDLFIVHLLLREADLWKADEAGDWNPLPVVPLFETIDDLKGASEILSQYLRNPFVMRSLHAQAHAQKLPRPRQQVMVGYSDSNKDGGVVSSFVALHQVQKALLQVGHDFGIDIHFFHGRGGTISRGAGPTHRFLNSQPAGALQSGFRLTEQGETISKKYANRITAIFHLESMLAGTFAGQIQPNAHVPNELDPVLRHLDLVGFQMYRALVTHAEFAQFFRDISPIDVLEHSRIGSRPSRRTGVAGIADLRAIPWNFSWSQNSILLSGWYGFGSAFASLQSQAPDLWNWLLQEGVQLPLFQYFIGNVATVLAETNLEIAELYMDLSTKPQEHRVLFAQIHSEYQLSLNILQELTGKTLREYRPAIFEPLYRREHGLRILHETQVQMLRAWRQQGSPADSPLLQDLLLNVNAIAAGLGHTG